MSATYNQNSPYYLTQYSQYFLDVMVNRPIPKLPGDQYFTINSTYQYRPDLLSFDLYDDSNLWWVFYQRNPNTLNKPPLDFTSGTQIYLPNINTLRTALGI
jgi:hypothetical protein